MENMDSSEDAAAPQVQLRRPWWQRPVPLVAAGLIVAGGALAIGMAVGGGDSTSKSPTPAAHRTASSGPTGLSFQQKQQILFKFCTSPQMRGPVGDSSAFPSCMANYVVTDQGMVMQR